MKSPLSRTQPSPVWVVTFLTAAALAAGPRTTPAVAAPTRPADRPPIIIDGRFNDWSTVPSADPTTWGVSVAEGPQFLYLHFRQPGEVLLQAAGSDVVLLLDTDGDANTGRAAFGIGADVEWDFGARRGKLWTGGIGRAVSPARLGLVIAPTVSTQHVELALALRSLPGNGRGGSAHRLRGVLATPAGVLEPEEDLAQFAYQRGSWAVPEPPPLDLDRASLGALRVANYNIERDGLFEASRARAYKRVFRAVAPDVVGFQEIFLNSASAAGALLDKWIPLPGGAPWQTAAAGTDVAIASRYPIVSSWLLTQNADAYLLDPRPDFGSRVLVIVVSLKCCDDPDGLRKRQIDAILSFWRDAITPGGAVTLPVGTPIIMIGDMNLVGDAAELRALRDGLPFDQATGPDFKPDWGGAPLIDLRPLHADLPMAYTWRKDGNTGGFAPGRLDFIFFTDSALDVQRRFVLHTPSMSRKRRRGYRLRRRDTTTASDHMPVVADFVLQAAGQ